MKDLYSYILALTFLLINVLTPGQSSFFVVDVSQQGAQVADICRGQQLEEFNYQFQGGLYAQLINNPSFEELNNPVSFWETAKSSSSECKIFYQWRLHGE
jgi:hypothetical protein